MEVRKNDIASALFQFTQRTATSGNSLLRQTSSGSILQKSDSEGKLVLSGKRAPEAAPLKTLYTKITADRTHPKEGGRDTVTSKTDEALKGYSKLLWGGDILAEKLASFKGVGGATTEFSVDESLSGSEHWLMSHAHGAKPIQSMSSKNMFGTFLKETESSQGNGYGLRARYADQSSTEKPIIMVETIDEKGVKNSFLVDLKKVDASNASIIEGFALLTHMSVGKGSDGELDQFTIGSAIESIIHQTLQRTDPIERVTYSSGVTSPAKDTPPTWIDHPERLDFNARFNFLIASKDTPSEERDTYVFGPSLNFVERNATDEEEALAAQEIRTGIPSDSTFKRSPIGEQKHEKSKSVSTLQFAQELSDMRKNSASAQTQKMSPLRSFFYL